MWWEIETVGGKKQCRHPYLHKAVPTLQSFVIADKIVDCLIDKIGDAILENKIKDFVVPYAVKSTIVTMCDTTVADMIKNDLGDRSRYDYQEEVEDPLPAPICHAAPILRIKPQA